MNFIGRVKKYLEVKNIKPSAAEKASGLSNGTLSKPISKNKSISVDTLEKFLIIYDDINLNWLFFEQGEMLLNKENDVNNTAAPVSNKEIEDLQRKIFELEIRLDECRRNNDESL